MKILFAPSEAKRQGGEHSSMRFCFDIDREKILQKYEELVKSGDEEILHQLFGTKELPTIDIFHSPTLKAVRRYTRVAYEYLDYDSLHFLAKEFVFEKRQGGEPLGQGISRYGTAPDSQKPNR